MTDEFIEQEARAVAYRKVALKLIQSAVLEHDLPWLRTEFCQALCELVGLGVTGSAVADRLEQIGPVRGKGYKEIEKMVAALTGNDAVAEAMRQVNPDVVAAYPITPQTELMHKFADYVSDGWVKTEFVLVESEHSAMSAAVGASAASRRILASTDGREGWGGRSRGRGSVLIRRSESAWVEGRPAPYPLALYRSVRRSI